MHNELVIILHGIARTERHMRHVAKACELAGYNVINHTYPSTKYRLEELRDLCWQDMQTSITKANRVHFIGYSMGGLLTRAILHHYAPPNLGRIVLLAVPNKGSEVADFMKNWWLYQKIFGPAGQQLVTDEKARADLFSTLAGEVGVLAGTTTVDPFCSYIIGGTNDGKVSVESTKLDEMADFMTIKASHLFFPHHKEVIQQTLHFLQNGAFNK